MKKTLLIAGALSILFVLIFYKDQVLDSFSVLGWKAKTKLTETIDEELRQPISNAIQTKIDETFDHLKETLTGEDSNKELTSAKPLRFQTEAVAVKTQLSKPETFAWTNVARVKNGNRAQAEQSSYDGNLPILLPSPKLDQIAKLRLEDMFEKQYFEHISPSGESASTEAKLVVYEYATIGENIALGNFGSDEKLVEAWMNSPGHRANILSSKFTELGIAVKEGVFEGEKTWIAVQIFAKPLAACPAVSAALKNEIDSQKNRLSDLQREAAILKADIESQDPETKEEVRNYNEAVEKYNALAAEINLLLAETKSNVETYNQQINAFNLCIAG